MVLPPSNLVLLSTDCFIMQRNKLPCSRSVHRLLGTSRPMRIMIGLMDAPTSESNHRAGARCAKRCGQRAATSHLSSSVPWHNHWPTGHERALSSSRESD